MLVISPHTMIIPVFVTVSQATCDTQVLISLAFRLEIIKTKIIGWLAVIIYLCVRILLEMSIQDCVRHLVAHLV